MFAGHIGAALVIGRVERSVNVGAFIIAAMFLDVVLWVLVLLGWESVTIPVDFVSSHQPDFVFPYSHGLFAGIAWSVLAGAATFRWYPRIERKARAAILIAAAVFHTGFSTRSLVNEHSRKPSIPNSFGRSGR